MVYYNVFGNINFRSFIKTIFPDIAYESSREITAQYEEQGKESPIGNWTEMDSVYYSIISLMTIGFGDLYTAYPLEDQWKVLSFVLFTQ